jgi:hypothetical protein
MADRELGVAMIELDQAREAVATSAAGMYDADDDNDEEGQYKWAACNLSSTAPIEDILLDHFADRSCSQLVLQFCPTLCILGLVFCVG